MHEKNLDISSGYKREKDQSDRVRQLEALLLNEEDQVAKKDATTKELHNKLRELEEARKMLEKDKLALTRRLEQSEEDVLKKEMVISSQALQM